MSWNRVKTVIPEENGVKRGKRGKDNTSPGWKSVLFSRLEERSRRLADCSQMEVKI